MEIDYKKLIDEVAPLGGALRGTRCLIRSQELDFVDSDEDVVIAPNLLYGVELRFVVAESDYRSYP